MNRSDEACPHEATNRATRCVNCCSANDVPPCVAAYLAGNGPQAPSNIANIIPLRRGSRVDLHKAA